jgi:hypothetical protein
MSTVSAGASVSAYTRQITMPTPPMKPNWLNPLNSVAMSEAYDVPAASAAVETDRIVPSSVRAIRSAISPPEVRSSM